MPEEEKNFISLKEAAKHCQYSQEYLSLRARQGKLKAKKIGRNWATTVEWVKEYEKRMEAYKKGKEYKPEEKKKKKKVEKKREKEKSYANIKDHLVLLLTGVIIGIVISTLVINFILIYNFSGFGIETQKAFNRNSEKIGNRMNQFSFAVSKTAFDNLKIFEKDLNDKTRDFKEGLTYSGGVFKEMITRNSYKAASKVG